MKSEVSLSSGLVSSNKTDARMRLFCFPYAGGGASVFRQWETCLPGPVDVCAVQPPGRENRISETLIGDIHELVKALFPPLTPFLDLPFIFLGHSTGALVAFEFIRELRRRGMPLPEHLIVSGSRPPHVPEPNPLHHLPEKEFIQELRRFSGTPEVILQNRELMQLFLPILRADLALEENYVHRKEPALDLPVSAFCGSLDKEAPGTVMEAWAEHTTDGFNCEMITGGHFFIRTEQDHFLKSVSGILSRSLDGIDEPVGFSARSA
ncbi:MAG: thioesterase [Desulfobacteraceae bacterium]|nr:thioesterase [Desulfobacteraceae bacterium]